MDPTNYISNINSLFMTYPVTSFDLADYDIGDKTKGDQIYYDMGFF